MRKTLLALAAAALVGAAAPALAQPDARFLGVTRLSHMENDVDVIPVSCRPRLAAIQLRARNRPAEIERVVLTYGNGSRESIPVRDVLMQGEPTGWIDLRGRRRCVTEIAVIGDAERRGWRERYDDVGWDGYDRPRGRPARVEVYGRMAYGYGHGGPYREW